MLAEVRFDAIDQRVAFRAAERFGEEFHDPRIGVHRGKRLAILVAPAAKTKSSAGHRYRPRSPRPGWSAGRGPGAGQWNLRSATAIGRSLIEAMRRRIRPLSANSQFSLP